MGKHANLAIATLVLATTAFIASPLATSVRPTLEPAGAQSAPVDVWLVTIADNEAGWAVIEGESEWLSPACRIQIESNNGYFNEVDWDIIADTTDADPRGCEGVADLYFGTADSVDAGFELDADGEGETELLAPADDEPSLPTATPMSNASSGPNLLRGINLAGDLEVTPRGSWGTSIEPSFFPLVADAGFDHVRIPIAWSAYTGPAPDYRIDEDVAAEVDEVVDSATAAGLSIVIDVHFFEELMVDPLAQWDRFLAIWDQISERYQDEPDTVVFELLNEPIEELTARPDLWNELAAEALGVVRRTNPERTVIIGPVGYNHASQLDALRLPADPNIVATIHTYDPQDFTHQGAVFVDPLPPTGVTWRPDDATVALDWADRSWGIDVTPSPAGLSVDFTRDFAALAMLAENSDPDGHDQLIIETNNNVDGLLALCNYETPSAVVVVDIEPSGLGNGTADLSNCGTVNTLAIQSPGPMSTTISRLALCRQTCDELIVTQYDALDEMITDAAEWAARQGVPLYIGEFGTLDPIGDPTDPQSRADWTRTIRTLAERNDAGWAYFELNGEFGAWDQASGQWIPEILGALLD